MDDEALSRLQARASGQHFSGTQPWAGRLDHYSVTWVGAFVAGERLVGFAHACTDGGQHAFLLDPAVDPDWQHRGLGQRLVARVADEATAAGCTWLHVDHRPELTPFYRACGFAPTEAGLLRLTP